MNISCKGFTDPGGRTINQDSFMELYLSNADRGVWMVADGLGGHAGGEVASKIVCAIAQEHLLGIGDGEDFLEGLETIIEQGNQSILEAQGVDEDVADMRTTAVCLQYHKNRVRWSNCGDSRLYFFREGSIQSQTVDDSVPQALVEMGQITPDQIRGHPDRNRLTRCLGNNKDLKQRTSEIIPLERGDAFLLCSDGFWELIDETEMLIELCKARSAENWIGGLRRKLRGRITPGADNITFLCIIFS
jgi:serine/threonine protein phosphatase PrpC